MRRCLELGVVFCVAALFMAAPGVHAQTEPSAGILSVTAIVPARTAVIVGQTGQIERIVNNSDTLAELVIVRNAQPGQAPSDDQTVMYQFEQLKSNLDFNRYGEIYHRSTGLGSELKTNFQGTIPLKPLMMLTVLSL